MKKKKNPRWFYAVLLLIPLLLIILLELALQFSKYGKDLSQWKEITEEKLILNPDIGARYFSNVKNYPHSNHDPFDKIKKENSFRVFVFGGSTTAGFPFQPNGSFTRYLKDILSYASPKINFEVVNLGITAVNSFTILDLLPGVIDQSPDLVIIYAGHNEFYGALGVGSTEAIGNFNSLTNLHLFLNKFKITQLLRDIINKWFPFLGDKNEEKNRGTLMARMASEKAIKLNSSLYKRGIDQFENNFNQILSLLSKTGIPVFVGTLSSNLLDQQPFISLDSKNDSSATQIYFKGLKKLEKNDFFSANSLLKLARDLDGLRFRAPSEFNSIIKRYSKKYNYRIIDIEKEFNRLSPLKIVGNNLMVDHLHPTLEGHFIIAQQLFEEIHKNNFLPNNNFNLLGDSLYSFVRENFNFSKLDSLASELRILNLLNDYPFVESKDQLIFNKVILQNKIDSLALRIVRENYNWEKAHQEAYLYYLSNNEMDNFIKEINVLISQYPYKLSYYNYGAQELILRKRFNEAEKFLIKRYSIKSDDFSTKWLGNINLSKNNIANAIKFLNESLEFNPNDAQVFYNLSIANIKGGNIKEAVAAIQGCLKLKPDYPNALNIYKQLSNQ